MNKELLKQHLYSFLKTYITVFLAIVIYADQSGTDVFTLAFLFPALKSSLLAVIRTVYKLLTENNQYVSPTNIKQ
jgi:hypothetical protein